jgi:2-polyprenyl-3-methyl-5-hydroxy-6-metoxy-1,4-benzoquinol methylase
MKNTYIKPRKNIKIEDCKFYHTIEFDGKTIEGEWDLTNCIDDYLGGFDFKNKRVIDVGAASGYLSFEMEKRGADVVSFDMPDGSYWDYLIKEGCKKPKPERTDGLFNSYEYMHEKLNSKNKIFRANIYDPLPNELGRFDVAVFGTMLSHVRDPALVLMNILHKVDGYAILINKFQHGTHFMNPNTNTWWNISHKDIVKMMDYIGFEEVESISVNPKLNGTPKPYESIVFKRC